MERFSPEDFEPVSPGRQRASPGPGVRWPLTYSELAPYYSQAERLYRVRGGLDSLRADAPMLDPAPELSATGAALTGRLSARGLHPYRLPSACDFLPGCESCQGFLCPRDCKNDSHRIALEPALRSHGATLLDECEVVRLRTHGRRIAAVDCVRNDKPMTLHANVVIVAAGALHTPALLLRSASSDSPRGLANTSGLVGRNLMRHLIDLYAIKLPIDGPLDNRSKEIAFNDFYVHQGAKLGTVQSFGRLPPAEMVMQALCDDIAASRQRWLLPLIRAASPVVQRYLSRLINERVTLAAIVEDSPQPDNRVELAGTGSIAIRYRVNDSDRQRVATMRHLMRGALKGLSYRLIAEADNNQRIAHACGTCRFGDDPRTSVLDGHCRAHDLDNLYVVDASFFPTSGGTNPSLTIAANALRVAEHLAGSHATVCAGSAP